MIIEQLAKAYEQMTAKNLIPKRYYCLNTIHALLDLNKDGTIKQIIPVNGIDEKKQILKTATYTLPEKVVGRTRGIKPDFLSDNVVYIMGITDDNPQKAIDAFISSKKLHLEILKNCKSNTAEAIKNFFCNWDKEKDFKSLDKKIKDYITKDIKILFSFKGKPATEDKEICKYWENYKKQNANKEKGICLASGQYDSLAKLHPLIKKVKNTQPSGVPLISANCESFFSYNFNSTAPISEYTAFAYSSALNYMLANKDYNMLLNDTNIVYWTDDDIKSQYNDIFLTALGQKYYEETNDKEEQQENLKNLLKKIKLNQKVKWLDEDIDINSNFYILGLKGNSGRISINFFYYNSFGNLLEKIKEHYEDLKIDKPKYIDYDFLPLWKIVQSITGSTTQEIYTNKILNAILTGTPYPATMLTQTLERIKKETKAKASYEKAGLIKAYLNRYNRQHKAERSEFTVSLNKDLKSRPYLLGRLFAVYERIQRISSKTELNSTIKDKYFTLAMTRPATAYPILNKLSEIHLRKIYSKKLKEQIIEILDKLNIDNDTNIYPKYLTIEEQGEFYLGYYHQYQDQFKETETNE